ncbi:MAG: phage major capsid protein, P2 family [Methylobacter sp.]
MAQLLSAQAKERMDNLIALTANHYGGVPGETYTATPSVAQTLNEKIIVDGNWLLPLINVVPVTEMSGDKIFMDLAAPVTSRTDTSGTGERSAKRLLSLSNKTYQLYKTESDVALTYSQIDSWAKFKNFIEMYAKKVTKAIGNDRVKIGFHGTSAATATNLTTNPNLQDVNKGWLQIIREFNGGSQYTIGTSGVPVQLGGDTFKNLDVLVGSAIDMLAEQFREDPDLIVFLGRSVLQYTRNQYYAANGNTPTEKAKVNDATTMTTYGGLPALTPPFFPSNGLLVTSLNNLSIYWQETSWRRQQLDNPKRDQYEDFNSRNEGYVVEVEEKTAFIENITYAPIA